MTGIGIINPLSAKADGEEPGTLKVESGTPDYFLKTQIKREDIKKLKAAPNSQAAQCDSGFSNAGDLGAYTVESSVWACWNSASGELRIATAEEEIIANKNSNALFSKLENLNELNLAYFDFFEVSSALAMFLSSTIPAGTILSNGLGANLDSANAFIMMFYRATLNGDLYWRSVLYPGAGGSDMFENTVWNNHKIWVADESSEDLLLKLGAPNDNISVSQPYGMFKLEKANPITFFDSTINRKDIKTISFAVEKQYEECDSGYENRGNLGGEGAENTIWICWNSAESILQVATDEKLVVGNENSGYLFSGIQNLSFKDFENFFYSGSTNINHLFSNSGLDASIDFSSPFYSSVVDVKDAFSGLKWRGHRLFADNISTRDLLVMPGSGANAKQVVLKELPVKNPDEPKFSDISKLDIEFQNAIKWLYKYGITTGTDETHFSPAGKVTRGQMALFLYREAASPKSASSCSFVDTSKLTDETKTAICWLKSTGITIGTDKTHYSPSKTVSRNQMAAFLYRFADEPAWSQTACGFSDIGKLTADSKKSICWLKSAGVTTGTDPTHYSPSKNVTRAQMSAFLNREYSWIRKN
jgi:hypothetical protein